MAQMPPSPQGMPMEEPDGMADGEGNAGSMWLDESVLSWFKKRNGDTLKRALAFVPWILQQSYFEGGLEDGQIVIHRGTGAVVFCEATGFVTLTESLATKQNGAELLSNCLTGFFTPLIDLINAYRGDVIKFSGDQLTVYFIAVDDTKGPKYNLVVPPHGTYGLPDLGPSATAILRASACCIEIHKRLNNFDTDVDDIRMNLHIGVGFGQVNILQVGGIVPPETHVQRCEYLIAGPPLEQTSIAVSLAKNGQTCLSPQAWEYVKDCVVEGPPLEDRPDFHLLLRMDESKYTFPTIKHAARENDNRGEKRFRLSELPVIRRYVPSAVFKQIECGTLEYVNEMRNISVIFISGSGLDVMNDKGARDAQDLMASVQRACYAHEGTLNKFLIDDKGLLFILVFGLPPLVHTDDPTRAVLACFDMVKVFKRMNLVGRFGVTSGRSYCGICGSYTRMEYTVLGDCVNLSARLMANCQPLTILCDDETKNKASAEIVFNALTPIKRDKAGGRREEIPIYQPVLKEPAAQIGLAFKRIRFPWHDASGSSNDDSSSQVTQLCSVKGWDGIIKASGLLGSGFDQSIHSQDQQITAGAPVQQPPQGTPFADGGAIVIEGPAGMGQIELAEHIVCHAAVKFRMMPVFGTMGPRPGDSIRLAIELLRSSLGVFRSLDPQIPLDDGQALSQVMPSQLASTLPLLRQALQDQTSKERSGQILKSAVEVVIALVTLLCRQTPVSIVMQFETGTSLKPKTLEDEQTFWRSIADLSKLLQTRHDRPLVMLVVARDADRTNPVVQRAEKSQTLLKMEGLSQEGMLQYMSNILRVKEEMVPHNLRSFVWRVSLGRPLYIQETLQELIEHQNVLINNGANGQAKGLEAKDLETVALATWGHTRMVGGTVCLLESLDPLESAVLKMSTCFLETFTINDLAASTCSRWAGATYFDFLRILKALRKLVEQEIVEEVMLDEASGTSGAGHFQCVNLLVRSVGSSMVLECQKKSVKRQALIDRTLSRELPARLDVVAQKKAVMHIPWYYEQAFKRMM
jgi:class 3 adenylate cyclase